MRKIVITSDKYSICLKGFQTLCNRHWKEPELKFTVLGLNTPNVLLQHNFKFESLGEGYDDSSPWFKTLTPYFKNLKDDYFFLCFEDHFLIGDVNLHLMEKADYIMQTDKSIGKIRLLPHFRNHNIFGGKYDEDFNYYSAKFNILSTTSLRPSIWRREIFLKFLSNPGMVRNPHDFEVFNNNRFRVDTKILMPKGIHPIYPEVDAFRKGTINPVPLKHKMISEVWGPGNCTLPITDEDRQVFKTLNEEWNNKK